MTTIKTVIPYAPKEKNTWSEREVAHKLADELRATRDQLRAAQDQINALEADVRHYQHRANRAEKWLHQISSEIEQRFSLRADDGRSAGRLGFLRANG